MIALTVLGALCESGGGAVSCCSGWMISAIGRRYRVACGAKEGARRACRYRLECKLAAPLVRQTPRRVNAPNPALARSRGRLCGGGHPGFAAFAAVAPTITMTVPVRSSVLSMQLGRSWRGGRGGGPSGETAHRPAQDHAREGPHSALAGQRPTLKSSAGGPDAVRGSIAEEPACRGSTSILVAAPPSQFPDERALLPDPSRTFPFGWGFRFGRRRLAVARTQPQRGL
jgi:hypothetical protein